MRILSIESSCDDTCVSILEAMGGVKDAVFKVLGNSSNSQINMHIPYGGVYPMLAEREHIKNLPIVLEQALKDARILREGGLGSATARARGIFQQKNIRAESERNPGVDLIVVTSGPGLEPCLWAGITFAQDLAKKWQVPIVPVNHMEGHVVSVFGKNKGKFSIPKIKFPIISLLVSGGHTQLVLSKKWMRYEIIGETLDDAVGEAFDKVARILGLPYPGGPQISKLAEVLRKEKQSSQGLRSATGARTEQFSSKKIAYPEKTSFSWSLPRPMLKSKDFNFSFAGLKTAVLYLIRDLTKEHLNILPARNASHNEAGGQNDKIIKEIALEFENAAIGCLVYKTVKAVEKHKAKTVIVGGGVACNLHLQREMRKLANRNFKVYFPAKELATDNSIMIGMAGYLNYIKNKRKVPKSSSIKAAGNLRL